jgi:hypothetical protein
LYEPQNEKIATGQFEDKGYKQGINRGSERNAVPENIAAPQYFYGLIVKKTRITGRIAEIGRKGVLPQVN